MRTQSSPHTDHPDPHHVPRSLPRTLSWALLLTALAGILTTTVLLDQAAQAITFLSALIPFSLAVIALDRRGQARAACFLLVTGLWLLVAVAGYLFGGIRGPAVVGPIIALLVTQALWGPRAGVGATLLGLALWGGLAYAEAHHRLPSSQHPPAPVVLLTSLALSLGPLLGLLYGQGTQRRATQFSPQGEPWPDPDQKPTPHPGSGVADPDARLAALESRLQEQTRLATLLREMRDLLQTSMTMDEAYLIITRTAHLLLPDESGALLMLQKGGEQLTTVATWGSPSNRRGMMHPEDCWALRRGHTHLVEAADSGLLCGHLGEPPPGSSLCVPLIAQGETLGVLHFQNQTPHLGQAEGWQPEQVKQKMRLAAEIAEHCAMALANLNLQTSLRLQAIRDPLTDLFNRRYMEESLQRDLRRCIRHELPLGLMMIDIDHFKRFNDTYGHEAGDLVLRELAALFRSHIRAEDIACRYGGEEFALILPEAPLEQTRLRAELLRHLASELSLQYGERTLRGITISVGVAGYPAHGSNGDLLLRCADQALYQAKAAGRDRVVVFETPTSSNQSE